MRVAVGIDIAKEFHWVAIVLADGGKMPPNAGGVIFLGEDPL
ncbi:IS110 family transposase [Phytoactinopolyspora alkaliphila]|uniref:IS110 family transposase n=1 Tax=Phytoactinopolyspora alkaliphila TaxID=1783498 RepID=A0A6N9YJW3_9ACTN|nr:IS110 family transposase [Phytoactinopolyspora alkaliphila]NED95225.1 IS110 family transposase [Phytoactinopolyspora alkaliphila]